MFIIQGTKKYNKSTPGKWSPPPFRVFLYLQKNMRTEKNEEYNNDIRQTSYSDRQEELEMTEIREYIKSRKSIWSLLNVWMNVGINRSHPNIVGFFLFLVTLIFYPLALIPSIIVEALIYKSIGPMMEAITIWECVERDAWAVITGREYDEDDEE